MKHLYLLKDFARRARKAGLGDDGLWESVDRAEQGIVDADLGGGLIKQRVARPGQGRSGGFRTIIAYRRGARAIFLHLFAKSRQANLSAVELEIYQELATTLDALTDEQLNALTEKRGWKRIERTDGEEADLS
jgi:hypothetical protein